LPTFGAPTGMVVRRLSFYGNLNRIFRAFADEDAAGEILGRGLNARVDLRMDGNLVCHVNLLKAAPSPLAFHDFLVQYVMPLVRISQRTHDGNHQFVASPRRRPKGE